MSKEGTIVEPYQYVNGIRQSETNALRGLSRNFTCTLEDHLITAGNTTCQYDVDGFLHQRNSAGAVTTYQYPSRGELLRADLPDGRVLEYLHDP